MINERIKEARKLRKMKQYELAEALGLSSNYVYMMEAGDKIPAERTLKDIARVLNVGENWLLTGEGDMLEPLTREAQIADIASRLYKGDDDDFRVKMVNLILQMNDEEIELFKRLAHRVADMVNEESRPK